MCKNYQTLKILPYFEVKETKTARAPLTPLFIMVVILINTYVLLCVNVCARVRMYVKIQL